MALCLATALLSSLAAPELTLTRSSLAEAMAAAQRVPPIELAVPELTQIRSSMVEAMAAAQLVSSTEATAATQLADDNATSSIDNIAAPPGPTETAASAPTVVEGGLSRPADSRSAELPPRLVAQLNETSLGIAKLLRRQPPFAGAAAANLTGVYARLDEISRRLRGLDQLRHRPAPMALPEAELGQVSRDLDNLQASAANFTAGQGSLATRADEIASETRDISAYLRTHLPDPTGDVHARGLTPADLQHALVLLNHTQSRQPAQFASEAPPLGLVTAAQLHEALDGLARTLTKPPAAAAAAVPAASPDPRVDELMRAVDLRAAEIKALISAIEIPAPSPAALPAALPAPPPAELAAVSRKLDELLAQVQAHGHAR